MGPASENAGYARGSPISRSPPLASMGPASENAGYDDDGLISVTELMLQWVRRPRTPVMSRARARRAEPDKASMGPASENAGYGLHSKSFFDSSH